MDDSEKMTALKKAYAEIILNTAKEAAARIMASERKAHHFNHDLSSTKDEALRLLLRLKQTMDSKLNEAEMKSLYQQRKIEELEAQLQEAEDIVSNLRADLNEAHMKLEKMEKNQIRNRPNMMEKGVCEEGMAEPVNALSEAVLASQADGLSNGANVQCIANNSSEEHGHASVPDVQSLIVRSKETELYRNGCTQRIRACEGNLLNGHCTLSGSLDDLNNEKIIREDKEGEKIHMIPPIGADNTCTLEKNPVDIKEVKYVDKSSNKDQAIKSFRKKRKRAARCRRSNASILKPVSPKAKEAVSDLSNSQTCLPGSDDMIESSNNDYKGTESHSPSTVPSNASDIGVLSEHASVVEGDDEFVEAHTNTMDEDREVASSLVLIRKQSASGDGLDVPSSNPELDMKNASSLNLDAKVLDKGEAFPDPPPKERVLKYTFQRKRKKESLSSDDSSLLHQENPLKRKMVNKQNTSLEPPVSSAVSESSRDSRRMAQVARQLISLSEKKWWK